MRRASTQLGIRCRKVDRPESGISLTAGCDQDAVDASRLRTLGHLKRFPHLHAINHGAALLPKGYTDLGLGFYGKQLDTPRVTKPEALRPVMIW